MKYITVFEYIFQYIYFFTRLAVVLVYCRSYIATVRSSQLLYSTTVVVPRTTASYY